MVSASNFVSGDKNILSDSVNAFLPKIAVIPLFEDDSAGGEVLITEGSLVREGDVIAKTHGLFIHSSVPGIVQKIEQRQYSNGKQGLCAQIALNGSFSYLGRLIPRKDWQSYDASTIQFLLKEMGVVNTFEKNVPLFTKLKGNSSYDTILVLRLFDSDPSLVTESFISKKFLSSVLEGAGILAKAFFAKSIVIAYSSTEKENLKEAIDSLLQSKKTELFSSTCEVFTVGMDTNKYPCGTMHDIASAVKKTYKSDFFSKLGKKDLFIDSTTALNSYNAIVYGKPVTTSFVHVTGDCLNAAALLHVRIGTPLSSIVEQCGGFKRNLSKIVINGILSGIAVSSLEIPVGRAVKSIEFIPKGKVRAQHTKNCIRCGNCRKICPVLLWPGNLYRIAHLEHPSQSDENIKKTAILCTECGLCNSVCSSRLPLSQTISLLKDCNHEQ